MNENCTRCVAAYFVVNISKLINANKRSFDAREILLKDTQQHKEEEDTMFTLVIFRIASDEDGNS